MLKYVSFCIVLYTMGRIITTLKYYDEGVCKNESGKLFCCFDYKLINGKCVGCPIGFILEGGSCVPCYSNRYGELCVRKCTCVFHQKCDNVLGCVNKTTINQQTSVLSTVWSTDNGTTQTPTKDINSGISDREMVIYSVVVACIMVIFGLSYLVHKHKKRTKKYFKNSNTIQNTQSTEMNSMTNSNLNLYDEVDETLIGENNTLDMTQLNTESNTNEILSITDSTSYLHPFHSENGSSSSSVSVKSVNKSIISFHKSDQNRYSDDSDRDDDTTSYLHPYHTIDEDWKKKTHLYDEALVPNTEKNDSSDSSSQMSNNGYSNPYQTLKKDLNRTFHRYDVPVMIHTCSGSSLSIPVTTDDPIKDEDDYDIKIEYDLSKMAIFTHYQSNEKDEPITSENYNKPFSKKKCSNKAEPKEEMKSISTSSLQENADAYNVI